MIAMYRILYVDDEPILLEVGKIFLEQSSDFSVTSIESATAALALLKREQFDAIVADYDMPGMNGIEFLSEVRTRFGKIPFIMFTGKGGKEEVIQAINKGADYYLQKGGDPELMFVDLSHKVRQAVSARRADDALRESEQQYRSLFENMQEGFAYCKMLYDKEDHPADFIYLTVNPAFDRILGTTAIAGKTATEVFPGLKEKFPEMFKSYGRVALNGEPESFDIDFKPSGKWLHISVYSPAKEYFVAVFDDITERKLAEEALVKSEARLHLSVQSANIGLWDWDLKKDSVYFSPEWKSQIGYRNDELPNIFDEWQRRLHPDDIESTLQTLHTYLANPKGRYEDEFRLKHKDGSYRWIYSLADVLRDAGEKPVRMLGCHIDITERKETEEQLRLNGEIVQNMAEGVVMIRAIDGMIVFSNPRFESMFGYDSGELTGRPVSCINAPGEKGTQTTANEIVSSLTRTGYWSGEVQNLRKDKTTFWCHATVSSFDHPQYGRVWISVHNDITGRKLAEEALAETNEYLNNLFDHANAPIIVWDPGFVITRFNHAFEKLTHRAEQEVLGQQLDILFPESNRDHLRILIKKALEGERLETVEIPILIKEGDVRTVLWNSANVLNPDGRIISTIAQGVDITERKLAEEELQTLTRELESRVLLRTAELEQEIVHRKAAEATITTSLNEKEILLREIHHRVKNNLQIITSLIRLQKRQISDPDTIHALLDSESRIRSMALVHEKLYRSTDLASIDFTDYIRSLTTSLITAYATDPHRIRLVIDVKDVSLDINRAIPVGLIMNELVANALKHAFPEGWSGEITIKGRRTPAGITLSVQDNGVGLPEGLDWKEAPTLGLHLVTTLIKQVNGSIELKSTAGTAFEMFIPSATKETSL